MKKIELPQTVESANTADIAIRVQYLSKCYHIYDKPHGRLLQFVCPNC